MNKNPTYIFVVPKPVSINKNHPGGQMTMAYELCEYAKSQNMLWEIIDTCQSSFPIPPFIQRLKSGFKRIFKLTHLISTKKIKGIIIFSSSGFSFYEKILMAGICRLYSIKSVFFMVDGNFVSFVKNSKISKFIAEFLLKFPNVLGIQGDSWRTVYDTLKVPESKIITIRNWISQEFVKMGNPIQLKNEVKIQFCFVGHLIEGKGIIELFEAIKKLSMHYNFGMIFVGGGTLEPYLIKKIEENNLTVNITVTGFVEHEKVKSYLLQSHVFILPSKAEGFPLSLLEALTLGIPAICTDVGAISDSLFNGKNGYLLDNGNAESIACAMERYLINPELIEAHSLEALRVAKQLHDRDKNCKLLFDQFV